VVRSRDIEGLIHSVDAEALVDAVGTVEAPWTEWATEVPALRFVSDASARAGTEPKLLSGPVGWNAHRLREPEGPAIHEGLTTDELLELASEPSRRLAIEEILRPRWDETTERALRRAATAGSRSQRMVALGLLAERGCTDFLEEAERFLRDEGVSRRASGKLAIHRFHRANTYYLERLPPDVTLERARRWFMEEPWPLGTVGGRILAEHATPDDRPMLEQAGAAALASGDLYRVCSVVEGLAVIGASESIPFLHEVYSTAAYSFARRFAVEALVPHVDTDAVARDLVEEGLWDCEATVRELACEVVSTDTLPNARRLAELADDPFEEDDVRDAAQRARGSLE
jgi:hypothetical protein